MTQETYPGMVRQESDSPIYVVMNLDESPIFQFYSDIAPLIGDTLVFGERSFKVKYRKLHYGPVNERIVMITLTVIEL